MERKDIANLVVKWSKTGQRSEREFVLIDEVLRKPLGKELEREKLIQDNADLLSVWDGDEVVGTMILYE